MMYNLTYLGHRVTLPWLDLRSNYTWFDAPWRDKHDGIKIVALPFEIKDCIAQKQFWKILEFWPLVTSILTWDKKWPKWLRNDFSWAFECRFSFCSTMRRNRDRRGVFKHPSPGRWWKMPRPIRARVNTRTGGGLRITPSGGGHIIPPPHRSQLIWELTQRISGLSRAILQLFWPKFWDRGSTSSRAKRVEFQKCWPFWQKRTVFRFFRATSVTIIGMKNLKNAFESSWNALSLRCVQISAKVNSLGYTGHQSWKKNNF